MDTFLINTLRQTRQNLLKIASARSNEELNVIPKGFSNNLIWNLGHVVVTHQLLCYAKSGLDMHIPTQLVDNYRKGTRPESFIGSAESGLIKKLALSTVDQFAQDLENGIFGDYDPYQTSFGLKLSNVEEAAAFNNVHEGMHLGVSIAISKQI